MKNKVPPPKTRTISIWVPHAGCLEPYSHLYVAQCSQGTEDIHQDIHCIDCSPDCRNAWHFKT